MWRRPASLRAITQAAVFDAAGAGPAFLEMRKSLIEQAAHLAGRWPSLGPAEGHKILQILLARIEVRLERGDISPTAA